MDLEPQAQAANTSTEAAPVAAEPQSTQALDPQALHEQLKAELANPDWKPEAKAATPAEQPEATEPEVPAGESQQATSEETPPEEAPASTETPATPPVNDDEDDEKDADPKGKRFRFSEPADRQFARLRKEGVSPDEAARIAYGIGAPQQTQQTATETPAAEDPMTALEAELQEVADKLTASGADEGLVNSEITALNKRYADLTADIKVEKALRARDQQNAQRTQQTEAQALAQRQKAGASQVVERFPGIGDPSSALRAEADRLFAAYQGSALMQQDDAPAQIAEQAAINVARKAAATNGTSIAVEYAKLEKQPAAKAPAPTPEPKPTPTAQPVAKTPATKITPASGANATRQPDKPATEEEHDGPVLSDPRAEYERLTGSLYRRR